MLKRLSILLLTIFMVVPAMAQPEESCECMFAPKAGQWEFNLVLGQAQFFNDNLNFYNLLPDSYGAPLGSTLEGENDYVVGDISRNPINIGNLNTNNLTNIFGVQAKYFITDRFDINIMGAYNVNLQPGKNFVEGTSYGLTQMTSAVPSLDGTHNAGAYYYVGDIFAQKAVLGSVTNSAMGQIGSNFYFKVPNARISPYIGVFGQAKWGRIRAYYPAYTGETVLPSAYEEMMDESYLDGDASEAYTVDIATFRSQGRAGQLLGFGGGIDAGFQFSIMEGLLIGFEINPVVYQYTLMHLQIDGQQPFYANNHNVGVFKYPQFKLGIRF